MAAVGFSGIKLGFSWFTLATTLVVGVLIVCIDILSPRRKLVVFAGTFFGLVVGLLIAYALSFAVQLIVDQYTGGTTGTNNPTVEFINLMVGTVCCYLAISFILQTKDDFRFVIPYVEFTKQTKGPKPILLDTSVLIDGRITDVLDTGFVESQLIVPQFVIDELQLVADSADKLKRNRGRRGLDVLQKLKAHPKGDVALYTATAREGHDEL